MAKPINPLKDEDCDCLDRVLESVAATRAFLDKCKNCGLPMDQAIAQNEEQGKLAAAIKREFFPDRL